MLPHPPPRPEPRAWGRTAAEHYRRHPPGTSFATSSTLTGRFGAAVVRLLAAAPPVAAVVEVGAGTGVVLTALHAARPDLALTGIDLRSRPAGLPPGVGWIEDRWDVETGWTSGCDWVADRVGAPALLLAVEFLDDLPVHAGRDTRAECWGRLVAGLTPGSLALLVDYGVRGEVTPEPRAYRAGRAVPPVLDPEVNLTAPVALDAVRLAGETAGAVTTALLTQREALARWGATERPVDPLAELVARSQDHALAAPDRFGAHWWLLQRMPAFLG